MLLEDDLHDLARHSQILFKILRTWRQLLLLCAVQTLIISCKIRKLHDVKIVLHVLLCKRGNVVKLRP